MPEEKIEAEQSPTDEEVLGNPASVDSTTETKDGDTDSSAEPQKPEDASDGEKSGDETPEAEWKKGVPFRNHPRFRELARQNREFANELRQLRARLEQSQQPQSVSQQQQGIQLNDEQRPALISLAKMLTSDPEVQKILGIDRLANLEKSSQEMLHARNAELFKSEKASVLEEAKKLGLDPDDVEDTIEQNWDFSNIGGYQQNSYRMAFRDAFWERIGELRERAINSKQIEEKKKLKSGSVEKSAKGGSKPGPITDSSGNVISDIAQLIQKAGGIDEVDFNS